jgi:hypothetical protein
MRAVLTVHPSLILWGAPDDRPTERCSICETKFKDDDIPLCMWSSDGWAARLCDRCAEKHVSFEGGTQ